MYIYIHISGGRTGARGRLLKNSYGLNWHSVSMDVCSSPTTQNYLFWYWGIWPLPLRNFFIKVTYRFKNKMSHLWSIINSLGSISIVLPENVNWDNLSTLLYAHSISVYNYTSLGFTVLDIKQGLEFSFDFNRLEVLSLPWLTLKTFSP